MTGDCDSNESDSGRQEQFDEILAELMRTIDARESVDKEQWFTRHPEFTAELRGFFAKNERVEELVRPLREAAANVLHVRCPHCHNPIELLEQAPLSDISCPSCGSNFSLVSENTLSHDLTTKSFGHFELLDRVGIGQFGSVWRARDTELDRMVAIKIPRNGRMDSDQTEMFLRDARAAAQLKHPNIVSVHEVGKQDTTVYIVSDFIHGETLKQWAQHQRLTPQETAELCIKIAKALHHAHTAGVIHRDLKPGNIMMDAEGEPHIVDFGLAKREAGEITMTVEGQILGTPAYMSPEQARGDGYLADRRTDIYSLGVILFELLTGELPFRGDKQMLLVQILKDDPPGPRKLNSSVPRDLETICLKCLAKDATHRYDDALQLAHDLERYVGNAPILARPVGRTERTWRWCRRNPVVAGLSAATVVLLAAVAAVTTVGYFREAKLHNEAESARIHLERSYEELKSERQRSSGYQTEVRKLEESARQTKAQVEELVKRRETLDAALAEGRQQLAKNEEQLYGTSLQLARAAWRSEQIELADYYLRQCPRQLRNSEWRFLKQQCYPSAVTFDGRDCAAISPTKRFIAGGAEDGTVKVWDLESQQLVHSLGGHGERAKVLAFHPDGSLLAIGAGSEVTLWNLEDGSLAHSFKSHEYQVSDVAFSPDGSRLASADYRQGGNGEVRVWNVAARTLERTIPANSYVVFNHDGQLLATGRHVRRNNRSLRPEIVVWDLSASDEDSESPVQVIEAKGLCRPAFHPHKNQLAVGQGWYRDIEVWNVESAQMVRRLVLDVRADAIIFSSDGDRLAYSGTTESVDSVFGSVRVAVWNLVTGEKERTLPWFRSLVRSLVLFDKGQQLATATKDAIKLWNLSPPHDPTAEILADITELDVGRLDWPQWGGSRARVNTPFGRNIPADWDIGDGMPRQRVRNKAKDYPRFLTNPAWSREPRVPKNSRNIKWAVPLGTQTYGNPVVANGRIFVGTNNGAGYLKRYPPHVDLGVLLCFDEQTGEFLWQDSNEKLPTGRVHDWPMQGVCSTPMVDGNRLWYVSNRGEVVCLDTEGFYDGEDDGPEQGVRARLFTAVPKLTENLRIYSRGPAGLMLRTIAEQNGLDLPRYFNVRRYPDGTRGIEAGYRNNRQRIANLDFQDGTLHISSFTGADGKESEEVISAETDVLAGINDGKLTGTLHSLFAQAGMELPQSVEVRTQEKDRQWSITAAVDGVAQEFILAVEGTQRRHLAAYKTIAPTDKNEADVVWRFDMMTELGISQHNMANCSMLTVDNMLFVCTSNGLDESHINIPAPNAPSFMAMDRGTGEVLWTDNSPGNNILHAQWASPSYGVFDGQPQAIFPGGDGWVYSFDPKGDGQGGSKLLWKFDGNPKESKWILGGRGTRNNIIAFPAIYDNLVYITMGQDPEHGEGLGHLWCIDPGKRMDGSDVSAELAVDLEGNVIPHRRVQAVDVAQGERAIPNPDSAVVWHYSQHDQNGDGTIEFEEEFHRSMSIPVIKDDLLYTADFSGLFHCLNAKTGEVYWTYDMLARCWGSPLLVNGKVYIGDEDGDIVVFRHQPDPQVAMELADPKLEPVQYVRVTGRRQYEIINEFNIGDAIYMTPIVANNVLYVATKNTLYAIQATSGTH